jgi:AcrR family transcriptional regulator
VTVRDVATAADVSPTTLLNHFPAKEALVVDPGSGILDALRRYARGRVDRFLALVLGNRDLSETRPP